MVAVGLLYRYTWLFTCSPIPVSSSSTQVYADDVLTKDEQIGLLLKAKRKCEGNIISKQIFPGE